MLFQAVIKMMNPIEGIKLTIAKRTAQIEKKKLQEFLNKLGLYQKKEYIDHISKFESIFNVSVILHNDAKRIKKLEEVEIKQLRDIVEKYDPFIKDCLVREEDVHRKTVQIVELIRRTVLHHLYYKIPGTYSRDQIIAPFVALLNVLKKLVEDELGKADQEIIRLSERLKSGGW